MILTMKKNLRLRASETMMVISIIVTEKIISKIFKITWIGREGTASVVHLKGVARVFWAAKIKFIKSSTNGRPKIGKSSSARKRGATK